MFAHFNINASLTTLNIVTLTDPLAYENSKTSSGKCRLTALD